MKKNELVSFLLFPALSPELSKRNKKRFVEKKERWVEYDVANDIWEQVARARRGDPDYVSYLINTLLQQKKKRLTVKSWAHDENIDGLALSWNRQIFCPAHMQ